ncbi:hypothetical protein N431DRAFT_443748 [Stipitochalara longipes BDJ]|nr:hypothetical protein N431DRAFT_443748 [Stipitochalara longipes BDJ]
MVQLAESEPIHATDLANEIVTKASGVFLWVKLVIRSLLNGLRNRDDISDLKRRLRDIPEEIEALYRHMMRGIESLYKEKAFRTFEIFKIMSQNETSFPGGVSSFELDAAIMANEEDTLALNTEMWDEAEAEKRCEQLDIYLRTRCAGLLEIHETQFFELPRGPDLLLQKLLPGFYHISKVQYLHRSVREFLETDEVRIILSSSSPRDIVLDANKAVFMSSIIWMKRVGSWHNSTISEVGLSPEAVVSYLFHTLWYAREADDHSTNYIALLDHLDRVVTRLWERHGDTPEYHLIYKWSTILSTDYNYGDDCNFLCTVVNNGLCSYVNAKLKRDKSIVARKGGLLLLHYALRPHPYISTDQDPCNYDMIQLLLQNGVDPNELRNGNSFWQRVLTQVHQRHPMYFEEYGDFTKSSESDKLWISFWARLTKLLLENGASPYTTCTYNHFRGYGTLSSSWHTVEDVIKDAFQKRSPEEASALLRLLEQKKLDYDNIFTEGRRGKRRLEEEYYHESAKGRRYAGNNGK